MVILDSLKAHDVTSMIWAALAAPFAFRLFVARIVEWRLHGSFTVRADYPAPNSLAREWPRFIGAMVVAWIPALALRAVVPDLPTVIGQVLLVAVAGVSGAWAYRRLRADDRRFRAAVARSGTQEARPPW